MQTKEHQQPLNIYEQIENLKNIGLNIKDEDAAYIFLNDVSYFRLIKAFGLDLKAKNGTFDGNVSFDQIKELYLFNCNFRQALFVQIEKVEINLRCRIANYFSCKYGNFGYEDASNFKAYEYHEEFMYDILNEINRNKKAPFVKNFQNNYTNGKLPLYALVELFSFGTLSKFFKNMKNEDKKAVSNTYGVGYTYFESWIEHIASIRNICAHYGRIYNATFLKTPQLYKQYTDAGIGNQKIYATLLCLKHILPNDSHWIEFIDYIYSLFNKYPHANQACLGFDIDWRERLIISDTALSIAK